MHEVSIILNVLDIAREHCNREGYTRINSITLRIGRASGVLPDALHFAFDASRHETPASDAVLIIEEVPVGGACRACGRDFQTEGTYALSCRHCGSPEIRILSGRELDIVELEVS